MTIPPDIQGLVDMLVPGLLAGDVDVLRVLRAQYAEATVREVLRTGVGLFVEFDVPEGCPRVEPADIAGGSADLDLAGVAHGATCVLFVCGGRLDTLEVVTYDEAWPPVVEVLGIRNVSPLLGSAAQW